MHIFQWNHHHPQESSVSHCSFNAETMAASLNSNPKCAKSIMDRQEKSQTPDEHNRSSFSSATTATSSLSVLSESDTNQRSSFTTDSSASKSILKSVDSISTRASCDSRKRVVRFEVPVPYTNIHQPALTSDDIDDNSVWYNVRELNAFQSQYLHDASTYILQNSKHAHKCLDLLCRLEKECYDIHDRCFSSSFDGCENEKHDQQNYRDAYASSSSGSSFNENNYNGSPENSKAQEAHGNKPAAMTFSVDGSELPPDLKRNLNEFFYIEEDAKNKKSEPGSLNDNENPEGYLVRTNSATSISTTTSEASSGSRHEESSEISPQNEDHSHNHNDSFVTVLGLERFLLTMFQQHEKEQRKVQQRFEPLCCNGDDEQNICGGNNGGLLSCFLSSSSKRVSDRKSFIRYGNADKDNRRRKQDDRRKRAQKKSKVYQPPIAAAEFALALAQALTVSQGHSSTV